VLKKLKLTFFDQCISLHSKKLSKKQTTNKWAADVRVLWAVKTNK